MTLMIIPSSDFWPLCDACEPSTTRPVVIFITPLTDELISTLEERAVRLDPSKRTFVEAGGSPLRRALRVAQLELVYRGCALFALDAHGVSLASDDGGAPRLVLCDSASAPTPCDHLPHVSVSHCDDALALALSRHRVGVDVERLRTLPDRPMTQLFSETEIASVVDDETFTEAWVRKEAYAKWLGTGLRDALASGIYQTDTTVMRFELAGSSLWIGCAGSGCTDASVRSIDLA